jgi:transcriptional regulator with GAF, ATPase, and Fis domain
MDLLVSNQTDPPKLLRVLQEQEFERLGSPRTQRDWA